MTSHDRPVTRRTFLRVLAVGSTALSSAALLGACGGQATPTPAPSATQPPAVTPTTPAAASATPTPAAAATTPTPAKPYAGVTLTFIDNPDGQSTAMIALQNRVQERTGIKLNVEVVPQDQVFPKLQTALSAKSPAYDIFVIDVIYLAKIAAAQWAMPVTDRIPAQLKQDILPFALQAVEYKKQYWGLPWKAEFMSFIYNKRMIQEAGFSAPPKTIDDLIQVSLALKEKKIVNYPMAFTWAANYEQVTVDWVMYTAALGGKLFDDSGNPVFNQGGALDALQLMVDMLNKHEIIDPAALTIRGGGVRRDLLTGGKACFAYLWSFPLIVMNDPAKSPLAGQFDTALAPAGPGGPYSVAGPMAFAVSAFSQHKDAAWEFIMDLAGPEGHKFMFLQEGTAPGYHSVLQDPEVSQKLAQIGGPVYSQQAEYLAVRPALPYYDEWSAQVQQQIQSALVGQKTPKQALDEAVAATRELQKKYGV